MGKQAKPRKPRPICLLETHCFFKWKNCHTKYNRCTWQDPCNQKGPVFAGGRTLEQMRKQHVRNLDFAVW